MKGQHTWHFDHAVYFFLGGMGAAAYVIGVIADFLGGSWAPLAPIGIWLGFPLVAIGALVLLVFLGKPLNAVHSWKRPGKSWIARGVIIITIFLVLNAIHIGFWLWPFNALADNVGARQVLGILGLIFAFGVMIYTGLLLGASRPIAFWSNSMLPMAFLVSALYTGVLIVLFVASLAGPALAAPVGVLSYFVILMVIVQLFVLAFYFQGSHRVPEARGSVLLVLNGKLAPLFWFWVFVVGLLLPLVLEIINISALKGGGGAGLHVIAAIAGLAGSLALRQVFLAGGVFADIRAGRFEYTLPHI